VPLQPSTKQSKSISHPTVEDSDQDQKAVSREPHQHSGDFSSQSDVETRSHPHAPDLDSQASAIKHTKAESLRHDRVIEERLIVHEQNRIVEGARTYFETIFAC
jgi:hypothetical protein